MAYSRRATLGMAAVVAGAGMLIGLGLLPATAGAATPATTGGCSATARIESQWGAGSTGGQIVSVRVLNASATIATKWTVTWTLGAGQRIISAWNAVATVVNGTATATNAPYNGTLAPGAATTFGMQLSGTAAAPVMSCDNGITPSTGPTGNTSPSTGATSPSTGTTSPSTGADVTVTGADGGKTVTVLVGQTLGVSLPVDFRQPTATSTALQLVSSTGGFPTGQPLSAVFRAVATGQADVMSTLGCTTNPTPCPSPLWLVHVTVLAVPPGGGQTVTVTAANNTGTVTLHVGDTLAVSLSSGYLPPTITPPGLLIARTVTGGYPTDQPVSATYLAAAAGQADVSTVTDSACNHAPTPCPSPQAKWTVHVVVTA